MAEEISEQQIKAVLEKAHSHTPTHDDFLAAIENPLQGTLSPWETWAVLCFLRHERRQSWLGHIVQTRLSGSATKIATLGPFGYPEGVATEGEVPDEPGWHYMFHGRGCCFIHRDGTNLDVDFADDGTTAEIDPFFFTRFLTTTTNPSWSEIQLRHGPPLENAWHFELLHLNEAKLVAGKWRFYLTEEGRRLAWRLEPIADEIHRLASMEDECGRRKLCWLLILLNDLVSAAKMAENIHPEVFSMVQAAAEEQIQERQHSIRKKLSLHDRKNFKSSLEALALLGREYVQPEVARILLKKPVGPEHHSALAILASWDDSACVPMMMVILRRIAPSSGRWGAVLRRLLPMSANAVRSRNGLVVGICRWILAKLSPLTISPQQLKLLRQVLASDYSASDAKAGFLLYLLAPAAGFKKIQMKLRSRIPLTRMDAAVILGLLGNDESIAVLIDLAQAEPENGGYESACMLSLSNHPRAKAAWANWQRRNDGYDEPDAHEVEYAGRKLKTWRMDDLLRANMPSLMKGTYSGIVREYGPLLLKWNPEQVPGPPDH